MAERLPPLNALRAFESAGRHRSFTRAARELHVTPGAVSHQIKSLEDFLGVQLFHRTPQALELTHAAQACMPELQEAFQTLARAVSRLRESSDPNMLTIGVAPAFAGKWLVPRLQRFTEAHPEINVKIAAGIEYVDIVRADSGVARTSAPAPFQPADLTIRFGLGQYPDHVVEPLCASSVTALCSPQLLEGPQGLRRMEDLVHHTLLHDDTVYFDRAEPDWAFYLESAQVHGIDVTRGPRFNNAIFAIGAAADGMGVALGMPILAEPELESGRLVIPFDYWLPSQHTYCLVRALDRPQRLPAEVFREWLLKESKRDSIARSRLRPAGR